MIAPAVFTLDIDGKPTLSFEAKNLRESWELCHEEWLREELAQLCSHGVPLWDGKSRLRSRYASKDETDFYLEAAREKQTPDDLLLAYLVELDASSLDDDQPATGLPQTRSAAYDETEQVRRTCGPEPPD